MPVISAPLNTPAAWSERAEAFESSWDACGWSHDGQHVRHAAVLAALDPRPGETLLDWGCGTGALAGLLPPGVAYSGFDSAPGMVARARREHPSHRFVTRFKPYGHFDLVACIGPFNLRGGWSKQHTWHTLRHLWDAHTPRALAVCLYAGDDPNCLSYSEGETRVAASMLGGDVQVLSVRNDLLLVVRRWS